MQYCNMLRHDHVWTYLTNTKIGDTRIQRLAETTRNQSQRPGIAKNSSIHYCARATQKYPDCSAVVAVARTSTICSVLQPCRDFP